MARFTSLWYCSALIAAVPLLGINECGSSGEDDDQPPIGYNFPLTDAGAYLIGPEEDTELGTAVAAAGDINGDGLQDLFVSGLAGPDGGKSYVLFGPVRGDYVLSSGWNIKLVGEYNYNSAGWSLSGGCDFNGDGYDDLLIGAIMADVSDIGRLPNESGDNAGKAYLVYGSPALDGKSISLSNADVRFSGEAASDMAGFSVACLGDLDNDGRDDIAIGASGNDRSGTNAGSAYLWYGRTGFSGAVSLASADAIFTGEHEYDFAGHAVARGGDVNGDGRQDLLVSAYENDDGGSSAGKVYVLAGNTVRWKGQVGLAQATAAFTGAADERAGWSLAGAGNVDHSGADDFLVGSFAIESGVNVIGGAYLVYGSTGLSGVRSLSTAVRFVGESVGDGAGGSVSGAGDVNGDGYDDLLFGAINGDGLERGSGKGYLFLGGALTGSYSLTASYASFLGLTYFDMTGDRIAGLGDIDGDGFADLAIGARGHDGNLEGTITERTGAAFVVYGP